MHKSRISKSQLKDLRGLALRVTWCLTLFQSAFAETSTTNANDALAQLVETGVQQAFGLRVQRLRLDQVERKKWMSYSDLLPNLTASAGRSLYDTQSLTSQGLITNSFSATNTASITAAWTIWDNYQNIRNIELAGLNQDIERLATFREVQNYIISVLDSYLELQLLDYRRASLTQLQEQSQITFDEAKTLVEAGAKTRLDEMDAEVQLNNVQRDLLEVEISKTNAERSLKVLLNKSDTEDLPKFDLTQDIPYLMSQMAQALKDFETHGEKLVENKNPEIRVARVGLDRTGLEFRQTQLNYFPTTSLTVNYSHSLDRQVASEVTGNRVGLGTTTIALTLSWKFWDWWNTPRTIKNARQDLEIATTQYSEQVLKAQINLRNLIQQYEVTKKATDISKKVLEMTKRQLDYSQEMYRLGKITLLNMQQASNRLFEAQVSLATRLKSQYVLAAKVMFAVGYDLRPGRTQSLDDAIENGISK